MQNIINYSSYTNPQVEECLQQLEEKLEAYTELQGKQDGQKETDIKEAAYRLKVPDYIHAQVQKAIDTIKQVLLIASHVGHVNEAEAAANTASEEKQLRVDNAEHEVQELKREHNAIRLDPLKLKYGKWLLPVAVFVGLSDGVMAYISFRDASYSTMLALITSISIAGVIAFSHILYTGWIQRPQPRLNQYIKIAIILSIAFIFFYWISHIRAQGINNQVNIAIGTAYVPAEPLPQVSQWVICGVSFVLFAAVMFLALVVWPTKEERLQIKQYEKLSKEIVVKQKTIGVLSQEIAKIKDDIVLDKKNIRHAYDYATRSIARAKSIGKNAIVLYKKMYARFHKTVPDFFMHEDEFTYDESLHFSDIKKQTT